MTLNSTIRTLAHVSGIVGMMLTASPATAQQIDRAAMTHGASTVDEAVARVRSTLEAQGYEVVLVVNHAAAAASVGLELRPTQVVLARQPRYLERLALSRSATIGIDLPIKIAVFEDAAGAIQLRINPVGYLVDRHDIPLTDWFAWSYGLATRQFGDAAEGLVTVESARGVHDTVAALVVALGANPAFRVPLVLDYDGHGSGPVLVVFGNPNAGTPLMQASQEVALDLPQKMLVWHRRGQVFITYNDPFFVAARHNIAGQDARLGAIAGALANFAAIAAGQ